MTINTENLPDGSVVEYDGGRGLAMWPHIPALSDVTAVFVPVPDGMDVDTATRILTDHAEWVPLSVGDVVVVTGDSAGWDHQFDAGTVGIVTRTGRGPSGGGYAYGVGYTVESVAEPDSEWDVEQSDLRHIPTLAVVREREARP